MRPLYAVIASLLLAAAPAAAAADLGFVRELKDDVEVSLHTASEQYEGAKEGSGGAEFIPKPIDQAVYSAVGREVQQTPREEQNIAPPPGFSERLRDAVGGPMMLAGLAGLGATALGMVGFAAVTRYISPKEALKNPQRSMLYGFIRATPGAHLKQLSEEFKMKTSSILWHIRKLEAADLVHSERANGFRVFYPTDGGVEAKRLSRAITALHNANAQGIQDSVNRRPGRTVKEISDALAVHSGTVRWHLRKLRDFGLLDELVSEDGSRFYPTPLGKSAIDAAVGKPTTPAVARTPSASASPVVGGE